MVGGYENIQFYKQIILKKGIFIMTKFVFLKRLEYELGGLPSNDIKDSLDYYSELIDDRIDSGKEERTVISELGSPEKAAKEIMIGMSLPKIIKSKYKKKSSWKVWEIILLALGSPIWLSLAITFFAIALSVYAVLWAALICVWAADISLGAMFIGCLIPAVINIISEPLYALLCFGISIASLGLSVLLFFGVLKLSKLFIKLTYKITKLIKSIIIGK